MFQAGYELDSNRRYTDAMRALASQCMGTVTERNARRLPEPARGARRCTHWPHSQRVALADANVIFSAPPGAPALRDVSQTATMPEEPPPRQTQIPATSTRAHTSRRPPRWPHRAPVRLARAHTSRPPRWPPAAQHAAPAQRPPAVATQRPPAAPAQSPARPPARPPWPPCLARWPPCLARWPPCLARWPPCLARWPAHRARRAPTSSGHPEPGSAQQLNTTSAASYHPAAGRLSRLTTRPPAAPDRRSDHAAATGRCGARPRRRQVVSDRRGADAVCTHDRRVGTSSLAGCTTLHPTCAILVTLHPCAPCGRRPI